MVKFQCRAVTTLKRVIVNDLKLQRKNLLSTKHISFLASNYDLFDGLAVRSVLLGLGIFKQTYLQDLSCSIQTTMTTFWQGCQMRKSVEWEGQLIRPHFNAPLQNFERKSSSLMGNSGRATAKAPQRGEIINEKSSLILGSPSGVSRVYRLEKIFIVFVPPVPPWVGN